MDFGTILSDAVRTALGVSAAAYALAAVGLNLQYGYTGLLNFGQVGFLFVGAYGTAITVDGGAPLPVGFLVGVAAAVGLGLLLGLPTLRLRAEYLAIVTIAAAEILRLVASARPLEGLTGGVLGIQGFANSFFSWNPYPVHRYVLVGDVAFDERTLWVITVGWTLVLLCSLFVFLLVRSPWGRVLKAIREDEDAARSLGKNVFAFKLQSLVAGGVIGALAGILLAVDFQYTNPDYWQSALTFFVFTVLILGGVARIFGPIVGSMLFWFVLAGVDSFLNQGIQHAGFDSVINTTDIGPIRFALVGLALILLMVFRPQGLLGDRKEALIDER
jgi:branched-chain amino acid transport system permease protein